MKPMSDKKPKPLAQVIKPWKPNKGPSPSQAAAGSNAPSVPIKMPRRNHGLLRFSEAFAGNKRLREAKAYDAELAGSSLIVIDKNRTSAELKTIVDSFAKDCTDMSNDGHTVIATAISFD